MGSTETHRPDPRDPKRFASSLVEESAFRWPRPAVTGIHKYRLLLADSVRRRTATLSFRLLAKLGDGRRVADLLDIGLAVEKADALVLHRFVERGREGVGGIDRLGPAAKRAG